MCTFYMFLQHIIQQDVVIRVLLFCLPQPHDVREHARLTVVFVDI